MLENETIAASITPESALLLVDVQNDFCPGGALAVPGGDEVVAVCNQAIREFIARQRPIFATRDWHLPLTNHFVTQGGPWPVHCVQGTPGAEFHSDLHLPPSATIITKGATADADGYSAFVGYDGGGKPFEKVLKEQGIRHLMVAGLATDYCVKHSVLDALHKGLKVTLVCEGVRGVDVQAGDSTHALREMAGAGAELIERETGQARPTPGGVKTAGR